MSFNDSGDVYTKSPPSCTEPDSLEAEVEQEVELHSASRLDAGLGSPSFAPCCYQEPCQPGHHFQDPRPEVEFHSRLADPQQGTKLLGQQSDSQLKQVIS